MSTINQFNEQHFWSKVEISEPGSCWEWQGKVDRDGYGIHKVESRYYRAHRVAHELFYGQSPAVVMHTCDNPPCCNPRHLRGGTQKQNMKDKVRKNRQAKGSRNGRAKLNEKQVIEIKRHLLAGDLSQAELARRYEISTSVIRDIKRGKTWKHVQVIERAKAEGVERERQAA